MRTRLAATFALVAVHARGAEPPNEDPSLPPERRMLFKMMDSV
jgi:hypothetical protein